MKSRLALAFALIPALVFAAPETVNHEPLNPELLVVERASTSTLTERALAMGLSPLRHNAWACALDGTTTVADVLRMTRRPAFHPDR